MWYGLVSVIMGIMATIVFLVREFDGDFFEVMLALYTGFAVAIGWPLLFLGGVIWLVCYPFAYGLPTRKQRV